MAHDDSLLITRPVPKPPTDWTDVRSWIAIAISLFAFAAVGWQAWETHQSRRLAEVAQGPNIEIFNVEFIDQGNLSLRHRNTGRTTAYKVGSRGTVHFGRIQFSRSAEGPHFVTLFKYDDAILGYPDAPTGKEFQGNAYLPAPPFLKNARNFVYEEDMAIQLRGQFEYRDDKDNIYRTPWCVETFQPYKTSKPGWSRCFGT